MKKKEDIEVQAAIGQADDAPDKNPFRSYSMPDQVARTELAYSYEPVDFFEAATVIELPAGTATFADGEVLLILVSPQTVSHEQEPGLTNEVLTALRSRQLLTNRTFSLSGPRITQFASNGRRHRVMLVGTGRFELRGHAIDFLGKSDSGAVLRDTKATRICTETASFQALASKAAGSARLRQMLESYARSLVDLPNALVHLYEIRDAASAEFGNNAAARGALGISVSDWKRLGRLANDEPIAEGRHRGKRFTTRNVTPPELERARSVARAIIESLAKQNP